MSKVNKIISFYRDCFEEENRGGGIANFLSAKIQHHTLVKGKEEHLSGFLPYTPVKEDLAKKLQAEAVLYQKEKELVYGNIFLIGHYIGMHGKEMRLIAPLIIYPCKIVEENELYFVQADLSNVSFNPAVIELLVKSPEFKEEEFFKNLPSDAVDQVESGKLSRMLDSLLPELDSSMMVDYPNNCSSYKINQLFKNWTSSKKYQLVPASGFGLIKKSIKTRNAISELNELSKETTNLSDPLKALFNKNHKQKINFNYSYVNPVSVLSDAQESILKNSFKYNISMVVGPPGTGKSFTISNLAINMMSQGKSVLICSRNDGAVDVIENQIHSILGKDNICVRGGRKDRLSELKNRLQFLLSRGSIKRIRAHHKHKNKNYDYIQDILDKEERMIDIRRQLKNYVEKFEQADLDELSEGKTILKHDSSNGLWSRIVHYYLEKKIKHFKNIPLWEITDLYLSLIEDLVSTTKMYVNQSYKYRLHSTIIQNRELLKNYLKSLRASNTARQKAFLESTDLNELFKVFPIWLTNTKDVGEIIPLRKEMFDLVIIDEASQCDVSTCIPLLQRAKRAIIVGDPKQLRHLSFLSKHREYQFQKNNQIPNNELDDYNYRNKSILDLIEIAIQDQEQSNFLDEHYRCQAPIIDFSNRNFYFNELNIMTKGRNQENNSLFHVPVNGNRNKKGINEIEIDRILAQIRIIIKQESELAIQNKQTIGILSPFRNQVDQFIESIQKRLSFDEINDHKILIGTAHSFQGEERDIMFLSFALDDESSISSFNFLTKADVFNVSITRAKNYQYIYTSFDPKRLRHESLLRRYIESIGSSSIEAKPNSEKDQFCNELCKLIHAWKLKTHVAYKIAGTSIDIAIEKEGQIIAIDLVGYPGEFEKTIALYKYKALLRIGIKMIPIPYSLWRFKRAQCEQKILHILGMNLSKEESYID